MQMYASEGGYKEHHYDEVEDDCVMEDQYSSYNKGSSMQMMKPDPFKPSYGQSHHGYEGHGSQFKQNYGQNHHGYEGHNGQFKQNYGQSQPGYEGHTGQFKHSYGQSQHGYGGHNGQFQNNLGKQHGFGGYSNPLKPGGGGFSDEYSESWYEEERRANMRNDYSAHGGKHHNAQHHYLQNGGMKHGGYGGNEGPFGPHKEQKYKYSEAYEERSKRAPVWNFKGIRD